MYIKYVKNVVDLSSGLFSVGRANFLTKSRGLSVWIFLFYFNVGFEKKKKKTRAGC